jgi:hypothetical protein
MLLCARCWTDCQDELCVDSSDSHVPVEAVELLRQVAAQREDLRRLAREATNGWACYAKRKVEHDEIARLHRAISATECVQIARKVAS